MFSIIGGSEKDAKASCRGKKTALPASNDGAHYKLDLDLEIRTASIPPMLYTPFFVTVTTMQNHTKLS